MNGPNSLSAAVDPVVGKNHAGKDPVLMAAVAVSLSVAQRYRVIATSVADLLMRVVLVNKARYLTVNAVINARPVFLKRRYDNAEATMS